MNSFQSGMNPFQSGRYSFQSGRYSFQDRVSHSDGTKNHDCDKSLQQTQDLLLQIDSIKIVLMSKNSVQIKITPNQKEVQIVML